MDKQNPTFSKSAVILLAVLCCVLWGSITPVIKVSYQYFHLTDQDTASLTVFAGIRYILCGTLGIAFGTVKNRRFLRPKRTSWGMVLKLALVQTFIQQLSFYISLTRVSGVNASILGSLNNFFSILAACLVFRQERLTLRKMAGCALGFAGVVFINIFQGSAAAGMSLAGEGALLVACISCGASYAMIKEYTPREDVLVLMAYQFLLGGAMLTAAGFASGGVVHTAAPAGYALFAYMAAMPITAFTLWGMLLQSSNVSQLSAFGFVSPITGVILSAIFLNESGRVSVFQCAVSLALVSLGIYVVNSRERGACASPKRRHGL